MSNIIDNPVKLHNLLASAKLPVEGVSSSGRVDYSRSLTKTESLAAAKIITDYDPLPTAAESRLEAYRSAGITAELIAFALWDQIIKADSTKSAALQVLMEAIDSKIN